MKKRFAALCLLALWGTLRPACQEASTIVHSADDGGPNSLAPAELRVRIIDATTRQPVACTVTLKDADGRVVTESPGLSGAFRSSGTFAKQLSPGRTTLRVTRGPEFKAVSCEVELLAGRVQELELQLERQVDLRRRGWFAGDSHVHMIHGERAFPVSFSDVALAARAEDLQYLSLAHAWTLDDPTPERLAAELASRSTAECALTWNLESPKNYFKGDAGRCLGHCWTLGMAGRTPDGRDVIQQLLQASAWDYESIKPSFANFESHALIHAQGGKVFYTHPARWWTGSWGGQGGYPKHERMRVSNMAVELPLDVLVGPTFDGLDVITGNHEAGADRKSFHLWAMLLNHGYRLAATASSDACFDRAGGAVPGSARLYTHMEGSFSIDAVARATAQGRTFATTGPLLLATVDEQSPGSAFPADGRPHTLSLEAWSSGAVTGGLARVELLRNGTLFREFAPGRSTTYAQTNWAISERETSWYCLRVFGTDPQTQRAISGAFFFDAEPWRPPEPVRARVQVRVEDADTGRPLEATLHEITCLGTQPRLGPRHRLASGSGAFTIPATSRLRAEAEGYLPVMLSPLFDYPALIETVSRLNDVDLVNWATFERIRGLLGDVKLTFKLNGLSSAGSSAGPSARIETGPTTLLSAHPTNLPTRLPPSTETYDVLALGIPRFVESNLVELAKIERISRFRSGEGHDYSDGFESCRSMKHYFQPSNTVDWATLKICSPVTGTVRNVDQERLPGGGVQIRIQARDFAAFQFILFHVRTNAPLSAGDAVSAGQLLGTHAGRQTLSDIAVGVNTPKGWKLLSLFDVMTDTAFASYQARGVASRSDLIIPQAARDNDALSCRGDRFADPGKLPNWFTLR